MSYPKVHGFAFSEPIQRIIQDIMAFKKIKKPDVIRVSIDFLIRNFDDERLKTLQDCHLLLSMRGFWDFFPAETPTINYTVRLVDETVDQLNELCKRLSLSKTFVVIYAICAYWISECKDEEFSSKVSENVDKISKLLNF